MTSKSERIRSVERQTAAVESLKRDLEAISTTYRVRAERLSLARGTIHASRKRVHGSGWRVLESQAALTSKVADLVGEAVWALEALLDVQSGNSDGLDEAERMVEASEAGEIQDWTATAPRRAFSGVSWTADDVSESEALRKANEAVGPFPGH